MTDLPDVSTDITAALRRVNRTRWALTLLVTLIVMGALAALGAVTLADQAKLAADQRTLARDTAALVTAENHTRASCAFYRDLAPLPVTVGPDGKASRLGVQIVSDSRSAFIGEDCPGRLPAPAASFVRWAALYGIPVITEPPNLRGTDGSARARR